MSGVWGNMIKIFDYSNNLGSPLQSALSQSGKAADKTVRRLRTDEYKCTKLLSEIRKKLHIFLNKSSYQD